MPKRTRLLIGALLLAAAGWGVDSFLDGGKVRAASARPAGDSSDEAAQEASAWMQLVSRAEAIASARTTLRAAAPGAAEETSKSNSRDPFARSSEFAPPPPPAEEVQAKPAEPDAAVLQRAFWQKHALKGVLLGREPLAIIDDQRMRIGDMVDGYRLMQIERDQVRLRAESGDECVLSMPVLKNADSSRSTPP